MLKRILCFFVPQALSLAGDTNKSKPSATVAPASQFDSSSQQPSPGTNTTTTTMNPPTTTSKPPKTTTKKAPTTTSKPPKTTTKKAPTTTSKPPKTTTKKPPTTTPTVSPTPTPSAGLTVGYYNIPKNKNETCLKAQMALQIRKLSANTTFIVQPNLTRTSGSCKENSANLRISFKEGFINFNFTKNVPNNTVYVDAVSFSLNYPLIPGATTHKAINKSVHLFPAQIGHSYSCRADSIYMGYNLSLDVTSDRMQAFNLTNNNFGDPDHCPADQPSYKVAIGVGVALLVLIVVVVVAYLVSRKRRTDGYQSL
uniref:Lysosome-associated membrane glycoprotein 2-like luminal domain-containing protein n=1 Tax=Oreochromis niloticus TaxID=8128 RepID=I3KF76_ORENI